MKIGANPTIFIIFFGLALVEAIKNNNWIEALLFLALGMMLLKAEN